MRDEGYKGSIFCLIVAAFFSIFLVLDLDGEGEVPKLRALAMVQQGFRWLLVEPLGMVGAVLLVMAIGLGLAVFFRPTR